MVPDKDETGDLLMVTIALPHRAFFCPNLFICVLTHAIHLRIVFSMHCPTAGD